MLASSVILKSKNWKDFNNSLLELNKKEKGNAFELLTKCYFKVHPVYKFYDEVWLIDEVPSNELKKIGIPSQDLGIDLIAKNGKEYHAIQCKYHSDKSKSVSFKEVSTFLSMLEGNNAFSQGYICSSANGTSKNLDKIKTKPINYILSDTWANLNEEVFADIHNYLKGKSFIPEPFKPRPHQKKAVSNAKKHFKNESRGKLIFPCGAGKSLTGFWFTQELKSKNTLIAVPSLSLIKQTLDVYLREIVAIKKQVKWLCICSDDGIGKNDDIVFKTENLGVPCQTDPAYIEKWLKENKNAKKIVFTTYQSGKIIAELSKKLKLKFDVGIFDEAHKTVGSSKKLFSHLLFEENISIDKRIFMTATERFYGGIKDDILSMDDEDIYGDTFSQMSFKEAIENNLLTDYKVITIDVKKSEISDFIRENKLVELNGKWAKESEARSMASMLALRKAMKRFSIKNAVSFHSSIDKAIRNQGIQDYITDSYGFQPIDTFTVSGKIPTTKRNDIVQEFANSDRALITNARCLTEGVDVPNIDCIVFADPRRSKVDIVQALGRALRKKEGKDWGYVILPVIYDGETNEIDNDNFNEILSVVRGLAANDERIIDYFKDKEGEGLEKSKAGEKIFNFEVLSEYIDESEIKDNLEIKLWEKLSRFNWIPFEEARDYVRKLQLKGQKDWREYKKSGKKPYFITAKPERVYKQKGWIGLGDFIGTTPGWDGEFLPFEEAREFVRKLQLKGQKDWNNYSKSKNKPFNIPSTPERLYKHKGWIGLGDWLGTGSVAAKDKVFVSFEEAREFVRKLQLKGQKDWREYKKTGKKPDNIPSNPSLTYKNQGWLSLGDFIGTTPGWDGEFLPFEEAREFVRKLSLNSKSDWYNYCKSGEKPFNVPSSPRDRYKNKGWISWGDWLGTGAIAPQNKDYLNYETASLLVQKLKIKSWGEWNEFKKKEDFDKYKLPRAPQIVYKNNGWDGFPVFFGKKKAKKSSPK